MKFTGEYLDQTISIGSLFFAVAIFYAMLGYFRRNIDKARNSFFDLMIRYLSQPVQALFVITAVFLASRRFEYEWLHGVYIQNIFALALTALLTWLAVSVVGFVSELLLRRFDVTVADNLNARTMQTQITVLRRLAVSIIIIIGIAAALMVFDQIRALGVSLLASAGVAGIVIGLAAQKTIGNFFTGLQIAITQPVRLDDAVIVEGEYGTVEEINLTYAVVKLWDQRRLVLPISYFVETPFQNWTRTSSALIGTVTLWLDYSMPVQPLRDELDRILESAALWDGRTKVVQVVDATERAMQLRVLVSASSAPKAWDLRCQVREALLSFIQQNYPQHLPRIRGELSETGKAKKAAA